MDYEKKYKEILEWARKNKARLNGVPIADVLPELAESEDERIRKEIISALKFANYDGVYDKHIAWLEKKKEPTTEELYAEEGTTEKEYIANTMKKVRAMREKQKEPQNKSMAHEDSSWSGILTSPLCKDKNLDDIAQEYVDGVKEYNPTPDWNLIHTAVCYGYHLAEHKEQKPSEDLEEAAEELFETIEVKEHENIFEDTFKKIFFAGAKWEKGQKPADTDYIDGIREELLRIEDNAKNIDGLTESQWVAIRAAHRLLGKYAEQEQKPADYDNEMWKNCEANFEGGKKEVIDHPEKYGLQKPAEWSEEDEKMLKCCLIAINHYEKTCNIGDHLPTKFNIYGYLASVDKVKSWLKSLRPSWKPSEEQMEALNYAIAEWDGGKKLEGLYALRNDLKKLM